MLRTPPIRSGLEEEFERQLDQSYRRNFTWLCAAYMALAGASVLYVAVATPGEVWMDANWRVWLRMLLLAAGVVLAGCFMVWNRNRDMTRQQFTSVIAGMIILVGALMLVSRLLMQKVVPSATAWGLVDLLALHLLACCLLPWRPRESMLPLVPLVLLWAGAVLVPQAQWDVFDRAVWAMVSPAILAPGALLAAWRFKRTQEDFDRDVLGRKMRTIGGELLRARVVHDAMFPRPVESGHIVFEYEYVPIQELGGDYVHLHQCRASGRMYLTLLDVAGHGLAAALTVNRLFGELERIRAEDPDAEPRDVMELLNRYINLTMAPYNLYATGACIMLDPSTAELKWVNAGHPPALVRHLDGSLSDLGGTTIMLGANSYAEFQPNQKSLHLSLGDVVIAYTDGAFEARNEHGQRFGIEGLRETARFTPPPRSWPRFIATAVHKHQHGLAEDDMLIATLTFNSRRVRTDSDDSWRSSSAADAPVLDADKGALVAGGAVRDDDDQR